jgi:hypothetical protein
VKNILETIFISNNKMTSYGFSIQAPEEPVYNAIDQVKASALQISTVSGISFAGGDAGIPTLPVTAFTNVQTADTTADARSLVTITIPSAGLIRIEAQPATTVVASSKAVTTAPPTSLVSSCATYMMKDGNTDIPLGGQATLDTDGIARIVTDSYPGGWSPQGDFAYVMPSLTFTYTLSIPK